MMKDIFLKYKNYADIFLGISADGWIQRKVGIVFLSV